MQKVKWTVIVVISALLLILFLQNTEPVETRFFFTSLILPRAIWLFLTAILGFACGVILTLLLKHKNKGEKA